MDILHFTVNEIVKVNPRNEDILNSPFYFFVVIERTVSRR
jgi:hypothetical protein